MWGHPRWWRTGLHVGVAVAHVFVEGGFDEGEGFVDLGAVGVFLVAQGVGGGGPVAGWIELDQAVGDEGGGGGLEVGDGGVEVLSVAGVGDPDGWA